MGYILNNRTSLYFRDSINGSEWGLRGFQFFPDIFKHAEEYFWSNIYSTGIFEASNNTLQTSYTPFKWIGGFLEYIFALKVMFCRNCSKITCSFPRNSVPSFLLFIMFNDQIFKYHTSLPFYKLFSLAKEFSINFIHRPLKI